jgi:hypothetical protein
MDVDFQNVKAAVYIWLQKQSKMLFSDDIKKLLDKCVEKLGYYTEQRCYLFVTCCHPCYVSNVEASYICPIKR